MELVNNSPELFHDNGCGGRIFKVLIENKAYLVKCENYGQSVNEYVAQSVIAAIGLPAVPSVLVRIGQAEIKKAGLGGIPIDTFGAVEYVSGLKRVTDREIFKGGNRERMSRYCELLMLDSLLADDDDTVEVYETEDEKMILLDLGEAITQQPYLESALRKEPNAVVAFLLRCKMSSELMMVNRRIEQGKKYCQQRMEKYDYLDNGMIDNAAFSAIERLACLDFRDLRQCFKGLEENYGIEICEGYKLLFRRLQSTCRLILKYR